MYAFTAHHNVYLLACGNIKFCAYFVALFAAAVRHEHETTGAVAAIVLWVVAYERNFSGQRGVVFQVKHNGLFFFG